jgi:PIN domain nuclease of toxin-antitoxin system
MPKIIVLDSHVWFWWINRDNDRLSPPLLMAIENAERVGVSVVSCYELAVAHHRNRLDLSMPPFEWFSKALDDSGVELLPVTPEICVRAINLSQVHRDPFDRMIIATALQQDGTLVSIDGQFSAYPELNGRLIGRKGSTVAGEES